MDDAQLLESLRRGDEKAFRQLVNQYHQSLVRVARCYVRSDASAEDVIQETWMAVMRGVERFEGRSTLKTWLFRIAANRARTLALRENRVVPQDFSDDDVAWSQDRFDDHGMWKEPPTSFTNSVDSSADNPLFVAHVKESIERLPQPHQAVVTLRDVEGLSTADVAELLGLTEGNVRVILHRGRARVREMVVTSFQGGER